MPFLSLGLSPALAQAAQTLGFTDPTPIQTEAIPVILTGADLLACETIPCLREALVLCMQAKGRALTAPG